MGNRSVQCGRRAADGKRCTRRAAVHGYCVTCWNLGITRLPKRAPNAPKRELAAHDLGVDA